MLPALTVLPPVRLSCMLVAVGQGEMDMFDSILLADERSVSFLHIVQCDGVRERCVSRFFTDLKYNRVRKGRYS